MIINTITVYIAVCLLASIKRNNVIAILLICKINFFHSIYKGVFWFGDHSHSHSKAFYNNLQYSLWIPETAKEDS